MRVRSLPARSRRCCRRAMAIRSPCSARTVQPGARAVEAIDAQGQVLAALAPLADGLFAGAVPGEDAYRLRVHWAGAVQEIHDAYAFGPLLDERDLDMLSLR